jgi:hypothetical protein
LEMKLKARKKQRKTEIERQEREIGGRDKLG